MRHPAFNGSGAASGVAQVVPGQQVIDHLTAVLGLDEIIKLSSVADTARLGAASTPQIEGRSVLAFQILDRNRSRDLASNPFDTAEGSLTYFEAEAPNVTMAEDLDTKVVKFNGDAEFQIKAPRGDEFGVYYTAADMFT